MSILSRNKYSDECQLVGGGMAVAEICACGRRYVRIVGGKLDGRKYPRMQSAISAARQSQGTGYAKRTGRR